MRNVCPVLVGTFTLTDRTNTRYMSMVGALKRDEAISSPTHFLWAMEKGVKPTQVDIVGRVNQLLRDCHELAVSTGSFSVLLFVIDDEVHCWASPELEGLVV